MSTCWLILFIDRTSSNFIDGEAEMLQYTVRCQRIDMDIYLVMEYLNLKLKRIYRIGKTINL